jgi:ribosome-associated heat shock protein Hsp15
MPRPPASDSLEDRDWQRLDKWLWCARFMKARAECARLVAEGSLRINRMPTDKPHARLRVGDVVTLPWRGEVIVIEIMALASRRGPAPEARGLYREIPARPALDQTLGHALDHALPCASADMAAYRDD